MVKVYELINKTGVSQTQTPAGYRGKIYICNGIWEFKCDEAVTENDVLKVVCVLSFGLLKVIKNVM